jgi:hypothetical protein
MPTLRFGRLRRRRLPDPNRFLVIDVGSVSDLPSGLESDLEQLGDEYGLGEQSFGLYVLRNVHPEAEDETFVAIQDDSIESGDVVRIDSPFRQGIVILSHDRDALRHVSFVRRLRPITDGFR